MTENIVDKLLIQAIESNKIKVNAYQVQIAQLTTQIDILENEIKEYNIKYQEMCLHSLVNRYELSYTPGGYDHVSEAQYEDRCVRCNKVMGSKLVRGTYA